MRLLSALLAGSIFGCSVLAQDRAADLIILNADIRTMDESRPRSEALAVSGNRISAVGSTTEIRRLVGPGTRVIDAKGRIVLPGFNDAHVHFMAIGNTFSTLDLRDIATADGLYERLRYYSRFVPKGRWILGSGGREQLLMAVDPRKLDAGSPENPVFLYGSDGQTALANSAAFRAAGISNVRAGVVRDGVFERIRHYIPADHTRRWAEIAETASNYAVSLGITSVHDTHSDDMAEVYRELERHGRLKTRIYDCISLTDWAKTKQSVSRQQPDSMVRTGCLKGFHDGDDEWTPKLRADVIAADKAGWQVAIHAIGAKPNRIVLDIFEEAVRLNGARDRRSRLEHAEGITDEDMPRLGKLGVIASVQPYLFGGVGGARNNYYARLRANGAILAMGSDAPMTGFSPFFTYSTGSLPTIGQSGGKYDISADELVLNSYTLGSAFAEFSEEQKGSITAGKLADIVILSQHISEGVISSFVDGLVDLTIVNGRVVFEK